MKERRNIKKDIQIKRRNKEEVSKSEEKEEKTKKDHYEPPGQNVSIVSQICLILVSNCLKRSKFCLKHVSDKMSQFGLNLRPF